MKSTLTSMFLSGILLFATAASGALTSANYTLTSGVLPSGTGLSASTGYALSSTLGLSTTTVPSSSLAYMIEIGFWTSSNVPNNAPTITGSPTTSTTAGLSYTFAPVGNDVDADKLTYSIANPPSWASFNTTTGALTGTAALGTFSGIRIGVSDGRLTTYLPDFTITVTSSGGGGGGGIQVPVMEGWWLVPGILAGLGFFARRRKE